MELTLPRLLRENYRIASAWDFNYNGRWVSKIGEDHDIEHDGLLSLEGEAYGDVVRILSRR